MLAWQKHINLIAPSTIEQVWDRHVADSLQVLKFVPRQTAVCRIVGSGGGFPGIVLACVTQATVHLYEANTKKASSLNEALRVTGARGQVPQIRLETLAKSPEIPEVDIVTARAFAPLSKLLTLAEPFLSRGVTGVFHKGLSLDAELTEATKSWKINAIRHPSEIDSQSVILEVREISRVRR